MMEGLLQRMLDNNSSAMTRLEQAQRQAIAANDNFAQSVSAANDNYESFGSSLVRHASDFATSVTHLKLLAVAGAGARQDLAIGELLRLGGRDVEHL